jgi:hypothetical protein
MSRLFAGLKRPLESARDHWIAKKLLGNLAERFLALARKAVAQAFGVVGHRRESTECLWRSPALRTPHSAIPATLTLNSSLILR